MMEQCLWNDVFTRCNERKYIGETINVLVTSVLQTPAGRMIFGKPKN